MSRFAHGQKGQPSQRQLRVGELVRHALADVLSRGAVDDPVLSRTIVSVAEVRVSADMRHAVVLAAPLGGEGGDAVIDALNRNARFLRGAIAPALRQMKYMPDLTFRLDTRFDDDSRIETLLRSPDVARDLGEPSTDESET